MSETLYCECGEEMLVQVGPDKTPLCITHFQEWLTAAFPHLDRYRRRTVTNEIRNSL